MKRFVLPFILLIAFLLRVILVNDIPIGFTPDEASFGYDAYSLIKTGKDQWGKSFPLVLESFGDFKSPLYAYLAIPSVLAFGLTDFAVRLPNVILGTLSVYVLYLLTKNIRTRLKIKDFNLELVAAILLAISPWHVMMSRGAFEATLITFFVPLGVYLFLKEKYLLSSIIFGLSLFTYHPAKLIVPIVFLSLIILFRLKKLTTILVFGLFFALMIYTQIIGGTKRISERSITNGALEEGAKIKIELINNGTNPVIARLLHNKYQVTAQRFIRNYKQYFSIRFLFSKGPAETTYGMLNNRGVLYWTEIISILGVLYLLLTCPYKKVLLLFLGYLALSIAPASLSTGVGYAGNRAISMIPAIQIISAFGLYGFYLFLSRKAKQYLRVVLVFVFTLLVFEFTQFSVNYFKNSDRVLASGMLYGNMEIAQWVKDNNLQDKEIIVDKSLSEPHIYFAFVNKIDPGVFQSETKNWKYETWVDQMEEYRLENYLFKDIKKTDLSLKSVLIGRPDDFPAAFIPDKVIKYPDGKDAIYAKVN